MFEMIELDPVKYREKTRKATFIVMGMFIVIGFPITVLFVDTLSDYSNNTIVLNLMGAFLSLMVTAFIVKIFFADKAWMAEAIYAWRLKRNLLKITNEKERLDKAFEEGDEQAMKILCFYYLGLTQMHKFDENSNGLMDIVADKTRLEEKMSALNLELEQTNFNEDWLAPFKLNDA